MSPATANYPKPTGENFASLLERLTGVTTPGTIAALPDFQSQGVPRQMAWTDSGVTDSRVTISTPAQNFKKTETVRERTLPRANVPQEKVASSRGKVTSEGAQLSYENALRMHKRSSSTPVNESGAFQRTAKGEGAGGKTVAQQAGQVAVENAQRSASVSPNRDENPAVQPAQGVALGSRPLAKEQTARVDAPASLASGSPVKRLDGAAGPNGRGKLNKSNKSNKSNKAERSREELAVRGSGEVGGEALAVASALKGIKRRRAKYPGPVLAGGVGADVSPAQAVLSLALSAQDLELQSRSATISVRLNEAEFAALRLRAAECDVSVSAYMRSCVLEAEQLRAQVKQALTAMRAVTCSEAIPLPALQSGQMAVNHAERSWISRLRAFARGFLGRHPVQA